MDIWAFGAVATRLFLGREMEGVKRTVSVLHFCVLHILCTIPSMTVLEGCMKFITSFEVNTVVVQNTISCHHSFGRSMLYWIKVLREDRKL